MQVCIENGNGKKVNMLHIRHTYIHLVYIYTYISSKAAAAAAEQEQACTAKWH